MLQSLTFSLINNETCEKSKIVESASNINHEELQHGVNAILGKGVSQEKEHEKFQGVKSINSIPDSELRKNPKYKNTEAAKQLREIDKLTGNGN